MKINQNRREFLSGAALTGAAAVASGCVTTAVVQDVFGKRFVETFSIG